MRTLSFLFWTTCSVAMGIWMATVPVGGRTPWDHTKRFWSQAAVSLPTVQELRALVPEAEGKPGAGPRITEHHTEQERDAVNRLVARTAPK